MTVRELDHVYYWTRDMDAAVAFYRDVVGLPLGRRDGDRWAEFDAGPATRAPRIGRSHDGERNRGIPRGRPRLERRLLEQRGAVFDSFVGEVEGFARFATFRDPDGNPVQLIEYRHT